MKLETWKIKTKTGSDFFRLKNILALLVLVLLVGGSFFLGRAANDYIYWKNTQDVYTAAVNPADYSFLKPYRNWKVGHLEDISAAAAVSMAVNGGDSYIVFEKNASSQVLVASLTKLLTAYVALKNYEFDQTIVITQKIVNTEEVKGGFRVGEEITVENLLYSMLIESSNDAAMALAEIMGEKKFVGLMNAEAIGIGLEQSHFVDPIGFDPDITYQRYNYSTAKDLALLSRHILKEAKGDPKVSKLFEITKTQKQDIFLANGNFHHQALSTNLLLDEFPNLIGAKTGQTPMAGQCFLLITPQPRQAKGYLVNVILDSNNRFEEMEKLINWTDKAFVW